MSELTYRREQVARLEEELRLAQQPVPPKAAQLPHVRVAGDARDLGFIPRCWTALDVGEHFAAVLVATEFSDGDPCKQGQQIIDALVALGTPHEPRSALRDTGIKDQYGKPIHEGDLVRVHWLADIGITELDLERVGIVTYMPDGFTAAWFVKFDPPLHMGVCEDGTFSSDGEMLCQTSEGDDFTHHFTKLPVETSDRQQSIARARVASGGKWPEELTSGVMFYEGERITRAEFETEGSQS